MTYQVKVCCKEGQKLDIHLTSITFTHYYHNYEPTVGVAKLQITKDITFPNSTITAIKQGTVLTLPHKEETKDCTLIMEFQDRSFFFESYVSLYYKTHNSNQIQGTLLQEKQDYTIMDKQKGKITKLTQTEFELDEDLQVSLF